MLAREVDMKRRLLTLKIPNCDMVCIGYTICQWGLEIKHKTGQADSNEV